MYKEKLLRLLVEKYRKREKNANRKRISIKPKELYKDYSSNYGDVEIIEEINQAAHECSLEGFVYFENDEFNTEIKIIYLDERKINEAEKYLIDNYHYEPLLAKKRKYDHLISIYSGSSEPATYYCERLKEQMNKNKFSNDFTAEEDMLKALKFVGCNTQKIYIREASSLIYHDSKYLEGNVLHSLCKFLREFLKCPCQEDELEDEILEKYLIFGEGRKISIKGDVTIRIDGKDIDIKVFDYGIEFSGKDLKKIESVVINEPQIMTVENRTSWLRMKASGSVLLYLGGFASRFQRDFLKKVYSDNPDLKFLHFGDIDAGGLRIHQNLCRITGIPFEMYRMSVSELQNTEYKPGLHALTSVDKERLKALSEQNEYAELAKYMLENNRKSEQEIISLRG